MLDSAKESCTVTSHTKEQPLDQGIRVSPSGLESLAVQRPRGSKTAGMLAAASERFTTSIIELGMARMPALTPSTAQSMRA